MSLGRKSRSTSEQHADYDELLEDLLAQSAPSQQEPVPYREPPPATRRTTVRRKAPARRTTRRAIPTYREVSPAYHDDRTDRLLAEGFALTLAYAMWVSNALFTILGLMALGIPWPLGLLCHIGISRWQHNFWKGRFDPVVLALALVFIAIDVGTTLIGMVQVLVQRYPQTFGVLPTDLRQWVVVLSEPRPEWWPLAMGLFALAVVIAMGSEYLIRKFWVRFADAWNS